MSFNYKPLKKLLIDRDLSREEFMQITGVTQNIYTKINNDDTISLPNLVKICQGLEVQASDVIEILLD